MTDCEPCAYFDEHKWIGPGRSHCRMYGKGCHRTWTAAGQAHCRVCHRHFSTTSAFDLHLRPSADGEVVTHLDPATIKSRKTGAHKLVKRRDQYGEIWGWPAEPSYVRALRGRRDGRQAPQTVGGTE